MSTYDRDYYDTQLGPFPYKRGVPEWEQFFGNIADHIVEHIRPDTVLDVGAGIGFLVEHLRDRGVDAIGIDISQYASSQSDLVIQADLIEFDPGTMFDLVTCIEVLEHLSDPDLSVGRLCSWSNQILFSSNPFDHKEPTHVTVMHPCMWSSLFAKNGMYRDFTHDASYISEWAVLYKEVNIDDLVYHYEHLLYQMKVRRP